MGRADTAPRRIDELLAFLPALEVPGRGFIKRWVTPGGDDSVAVLRYPEYEEDVERFFRLAAHEFWQDHEYDPETAGTMLADPATVAAADLQQVKTMLTYCVRGERFCDGHWDAVLRGGYVASLLHRLRELREQMPTHGQ